MVSIRKRGAVYGVIGLMLCVAVYLNWSYFQSPTELTVATQNSEETKETSENVYGEVTSVNADSNAKSEKKSDAKSSAAAASSTDHSEYFSQARLDRQTARDEALSILKETLASDDASDSAKEEASTKISNIAANSVKESKIEGLIQSKGYQDAVVYIEDGEIRASVAAEKGDLTETDVAKIADIIVSETDSDLSAVKISDINAGNS